MPKGLLTALFLALFNPPAVLAAAACPPPADWVAKAPAGSPYDASAALLRNRKLVETTPLGIGHIHPTGEAAVSDWIEKAVLPLATTPGGEPDRLLARGWLLDRNGAGQAFDLGGLLETGYEVRTFLVLGMENDWYQLQLESPGQPIDRPWVPGCALAAGDPPLDFTPWGQWLMSDNLSPLYFRSPKPHNLRSGPGTNHATLGGIVGDHALRPIAMRGDWMQVEVSQPSDYCAEVRSRKRTGWIKWRSDERGPWVWYYPRGC